MGINVLFPPKSAAVTGASNGPQKVGFAVECDLRRLMKEPGMQFCEFPAAETAGSNIFKRRN